MKKKIGCLLLATMILSLVGCGEKTNQYGTVDFDVTVTAIYEMHEPELTEGYIKEYLGYDSEEDMKKQIKNELQEAFDENEENQLKSQLIEKVVENSKVSNYDNELYQEMKDYVEAEYIFSELTDEELEERTLFYVTKKIVVEQIAINEGLVVTDEEYSKKVEEEADSLMQSVEEYENEYENKKEDILYDLLEEKVMKFLVDNAKITEEKVK